MSRFFRFLRRQGRDFVELENAVICMLWGIILMLNPNTFSLSPQYSHMMLSEQAWCCIMLLFGGAGLFSYFSDWEVPRKIVSIAGVFVWSTVSYAMIVTGKAPLAFSIFPVFAAGNFITFMTTERVSRG